MECAHRELAATCVQAPSPTPIKPAMWYGFKKVRLSAPPLAGPRTSRRLFGIYDEQGVYRHGCLYFVLLIKMKTETYFLYTPKKKGGSSEGRRKRATKFLKLVVQSEFVPK